MRDGGVSALTPTRPANVLMPRDYCHERDCLPGPTSSFVPRRGRGRPRVGPRGRRRQPPHVGRTDAPVDRARDAWADPADGVLLPAPGPDDGAVTPRAG